MNTIISHHGQEYRMSVIYLTTSHQYVLQFASCKTNRSQAVKCIDYSDAAHRFEQNCRFYGIGRVAIPTEEEFLGLEAGTLYPKEKTDASNK